MDEFLIVRRPGSRVIGYKGHFKELLYSEFQEWDNAAIVQPWDRNKNPSVLLPQEIREDINSLHTWTDFAIPPLPENITTQEKDGFIGLVRNIQLDINKNQSSKIVASRAKVMSRKMQPIMQIFENVERAFPNALVYLLRHKDFGIWIGASPELYVQKHEAEISTVALAGTLKQKQDSWTPKEEAEQSITAKFIEEILSEAGASGVKKEALHTIQSGDLLHLINRFSFALPQKPFQEFLKILHPTPAVGGYPRDKALQFIEMQESVHRELYTGWIGFWENGNFYSHVNLRCARIFADHALLYAGCGINQGSVPEQEWLESEAKMNVIGSWL